MIDVSLGVVVILITAFGYFSNFLNWRYLNYRIIRLLYYIGAIVHETSHAILCILTGAKIQEFTVFSDQPHVVHGKSKLPFLGELLISLAPIAGGLLFLFLVNHFCLKDYFVIPQFSIQESWRNILLGPLKLLLQINLLHWQSWVMLFLSFNAGAMLGPSVRDLKNVWPALIVLLFIKSPFLASICLAALSLIFVNIILQATVILILKMISAIWPGR
jgi:hypothetical protein